MVVSCHTYILQLPSSCLVFALIGRETASSLLLYPRDSDAMFMVARLLVARSLGFYTCMATGPRLLSFFYLEHLVVLCHRLLTLTFDKTASGYAQSAVERSALRAVLLPVLCVPCKHCKELRACSFFVISMFLHQEKVLMSCFVLCVPRIR